MGKGLLDVGLRVGQNSLCDWAWGIVGRPLYNKSGTVKDKSGCIMWLPDDTLEWGCILTFRLCRWSLGSTHELSVCLSCCKEHASNLAKDETSPWGLDVII
jgi:hypothetical protein